MADIVLLFILKGRDCMSKVLIEVLVIILIAGSYLILYSAVRVISTIIILFLIVNMNENSSKIKVKGGEGYGMFDKATRIEIIFNDNEYIVSNPDEIEQIIRLCRQNWEPSNTHITKEDCDMCVKFIGTDTEVWVDTETLSSYIGESFVQMPEDLFKKIKEVVSLSNTPRPGKFVYKLMFLKFSRLIF